MRRLILEFFVLLPTFCGLSFALICYECFHSSFDDFVWGPQNSTAFPPQICERKNNCTPAEGGVCILNQNARAKRFSAYCVSGGLSENGEKVRKNGCWPMANDTDEVICFCTDDFCNEVHEFDQTGGSSRFARLESNPLANERESDESSINSVLDAETGKNLLDLALQANDAFTEEFDSVPENFSDYQVFLEDAKEFVRNHPRYITVGEASGDSSAGFALRPTKPTLIFGVLAVIYSICHSNNYRLSANI